LVSREYDRPMRRASIRSKRSWRRSSRRPAIPAPAAVADAVFSLVTK
jgi:hypothetical protein